MSTCLLLVNMSCIEPFRTTPSQWCVSSVEVPDGLTVSQAKEMECILSSANGSSNTISEVNHSLDPTILNNCETISENISYTQDAKDLERQILENEHQSSADDGRCNQSSCSNISNLQDVGNYCSFYFHDRSEADLLKQQQNGIFLTEGDLVKLSDLSPDIMNFEGSVGSELLKVVDSDEDEDLIVDGSDTESEISVSDVGDMATSSGAGHYELHCMVCGLPRSHTVEANFLHIDNTFPLTLVSKTPVLLKLIDIIPSDMQPKLNIGDNLICRRCFNLIDSADILELRLTSVKKELYDFVSRVHRSKSSVVEVTQRNVAGYTPHNGWEGAAYNPDVLGGTLQSLQLVEYAKHLNGCTSKCRVPDSVPMTNRISSKDGPSSLEDKRLPYSPSSVQFSPLKLPYLPLLSPNSSSLYPSSSFWQGVGYITTELFSPPVNESVENVVTSSSIQNDKKEIENELPKEHKNESVEENSEAVNFPVRTAEKETKKVLSISSSSVDNIKRCRGSFQCDRCGRTFSQKPRLMNHLKKHSDDFTFKCQYCSKGYTVELNLMLHLRSHKDKRPYLCNRCPASFLKTEDLQSHLLFCLDKTFPCTKCIKMFASSEKLEMHVSTHHMKDNNEPPIKKHECKVCEKRFRYAAELQNHLLSHDNNKSFHCDICNRAYKHKRHLNRHYRDSHTNQSSKETKSHRKLENSIVCEKNSEKKSICPICKKAVRRINVHMISHSNVKGFSCGKCNAEFTLKHSLVRHIQRKHSNENLPDKKS